MARSISVAITTYNRPESCLRLLRDLAKNSTDHRVRVTVFDDSSSESYQQVQGFLRSKGWQWVRAEKNHGKKNWWKMASGIMARWQDDAADIFYFLQDDIRLCEGFFEKTLAQWDQVADPRKVSLYLHRDRHRDKVGVKCWTDFPSRVEGTAERTQWCDCAAFMANPQFPWVLNGKLDPVPATRWHKNPTRSSGVGEQWSRRLHRARRNMYRTLHSYVLHIDGRASMMNEGRADNVDSVRFIDGPEKEREILSEYETVTASLATIPSRRGSLAKVVARLLPQVDRLNVYLNETPKIPGGDGYPNLPAFLQHPKINAVWSKDTDFGDMGDAGKFYWASEVQGWHIVCDDDVLYPPDFVATLIRGAERFGRRCAVGMHGAVLVEPFVAYYGSRRTHHFSRELRRDESVQILASNSLCYHTDTIKVHRDDFKHPNMGDIWFGLLAQKQRVPLVCLAHKAKWLVDDVSTRGDSIYAHSKKKVQGSTKNTADVQTQVVKANMPWHVFAPSGRIIKSVGKKTAPAAQVSKKKPLNTRKAAFLVAATERPLLLAGVLRSLQQQVPMEGWEYEILVSGSETDPSRLIAEIAGARYIPCEGPYPGHKINCMMRETDADLLMLADDDDIQSPLRAKASIEAMASGYAWSSTSQFWCMDQATGKAAWWSGPAHLVGTTISIRADVARSSDGWPARAEGKDGLFASRVRKAHPEARLADLSPIIGESTVTIQHADNIHRRRPFPAPNTVKRHGRFDVTGKGDVFDQGLPAELAYILRGVLL